MRRSRAFILTEQLLTIILQAGFILVLCGSFYMVTSFYTSSQQVLTARNHSERVISFLDDKIRGAGLGLWQCTASEAIRWRLGKIDTLGTKELSTNNKNGNNRGYKLPIAITRNDNINDKPLIAEEQNTGDCLTLLYAYRSLASGDDYEAITAFASKTTLDFEKNGAGFLDDTKLTGKATLLDATNLEDKSIFTINGKVENIKSYAVMEALGYPLHLGKRDGNDLIIDIMNNTGGKYKYSIDVPAGGELLGLDCVHVFVGNRIESEGNAGQLICQTLDSSGSWGDKYNQEKGILDIYMERKDNTFTIWVLGTGGYDANANNPKPESWPEEANWDEKEYPHHTVYVARATWKLNNIPDGFTWN